MKHFHKKRLLKLADFLDNLPPQKFDFASVTYVGDKPMLEALKAREESCGTTACAMGWIPAVFPKLTKWVKTTYAEKGREALSVTEKSNQVNRVSPWQIWEFCVRFFGLDLTNARYLFNPHGAGEKPSHIGRNATAKEVATHIRRFVENPIG